MPRRLLPDAEHVDMMSEIGAGVCRLAAGSVLKANLDLILAACPSLEFRRCEEHLRRSNPEATSKDWIASSQGLLAMTLDCFVAEFIIGPAKRPDPFAPRNDGNIMHR